MKNLRTAFTAVLILIVLVLTGCYMDTSATPGGEPIFLQPRDVFDNFDGNGEYIVVRMYKTSVVDSLLEGAEPEISYFPGDSIYYDYPTLPAPEMIYAGFLSDPLGNPPPFGSLVIPYVPAGSYRFIVERGSFSVSAEPPFISFYGINFAGVTGAFTVNTGESVEITIALDNFGGV